MDEVASSELILGGQRSGKSRHAELLASQWLSSGLGRAIMLATAQPWDDEMKARIARHQADRATRVPGMITIEEPLHLAHVIALHSQPQTLIVVDCLTLWLTNLLMPVKKELSLSDEEVNAQVGDLCNAVMQAKGPLAMVSNEIGLGLIPMGQEVRRFLDSHGRMNQHLASVCQRVTLMVAGCSLRVKG